MDLVLTTNATPWTMLEKNIGWIVDSNLKDFEVTLKKFLWN